MNSTYPSHNALNCICCIFGRWNNGVFSSIWSTCGWLAS